MRLNYKILWLEDDDGFYDSLDFDGIRSHLGSKGFEPTTTRMKGEEDPEELIREAQKSDLVVMDFALEGAQQGDDLIRLIRDHSINTEVVFYSAAGVRRLRERVLEKELDGVYCLGRDDILIDVLPIIDSTIRKVLDLENSRGLVMAELGEVDLLMNEIIITVHNCGEDKRDFIIQKMKARLEGQANSLARKLEEIGDLAINDIVVELDSSKRLDTMSSICRELGIDGYRERLHGYHESVLFPRNCLGHGVPKENPEGGYVFRHRGRDYPFNEQTSAELRKNFMDFKTCLHELQAKLLALCGD